MLIKEERLIMNNNEKYIQAFVEMFNIKPEEAPALKYQCIQAWDSVGHMALMAKLEESFEIMMEPDDIIDFSSFEKGKAILAEKYDIDFDA